MKKLYANILGNWTELTNENTVFHTANSSTPSIWMEESMFEQIEDVDEYFKNKNGYDFISLNHAEVDYRIHISQFQIVVV